MRHLLEPDAHALPRGIQPSEAEQTETALTRLLSSIEVNGGPGPAGSSYREALRRHGETLASLAGPEGLAAATDRLCVIAGPQHVETRRALLSQAWAGLGGATS